MTRIKFMITRELMELRLNISVAFYFLGRYLAPTRTLRMDSAYELNSMIDLRWASKIFFDFPPDSPEFSRMYYKIEEFAQEDARWKPLVKQAARLMGIDRE